MEQFVIKPIIPIKIGQYDISFTNSSFFMVATVIVSYLHSRDEDDVNHYVRIGRNDMWFNKENAIRKELIPIVERIQNKLKEIEELIWPTQYACAIHPRTQR